MSKDPDAYRTISEVAATLDIPPHVLRFWETKFPSIKPLKRGGGRRFYRRVDVDLLRTIRRLLYEDGYTIRGVQRLLKTRGAANVAAMSPGERPSPEDIGPDVAEAEGAAIDGGPDRSLIERLAAEIAACRAILSSVSRDAPATDAPRT